MASYKVDVEDKGVDGQKRGGEGGGGLAVAGL